ncbi:PEPxxWA-CTERM sorting domain-containing protein [Phenylobacterium sp.]|uniref:lectin-like domain-containing protein n=1 Tax=Phenylobacterium sp. TaxID=1871053 RepID=UPI0035AFD5FC
MKVGLLGAAAALALMSSPALATTIVFNDFSSTAGLKLNGAAAAANDGARQVLRVTPSNYNQAGSVFSTSPITLGADVSFSTRFTFNFNHQLGGGADGIVFTVQTNSNDVGGAGGGIGYQGIANSVGIEFDNWYNAGYDPDANHVGIDLNGNITSVLWTTSPFVLDAGQDLTAWVDYNGATNLLEVRLASSNIRPVAALLSHTVNLAAVLGTPDAFVGFTSGTGAAAANHDIVNWEFRSTYSPITGGVPEPATWAMMIVGFGMVGGLARRRGAVQRLA